MGSFAIDLDEILLYGKEKAGYSAKNKVADIILTTLFALTFLFGTTGNIIVYYYFRVKRRFRQTIPELIFSYMALVDFSSVFFNSLYYGRLTIHNTEWSFGRFLCKTVPPFGSILLTIPGGLFVIIAFDRERAIIFSTTRQINANFTRRFVFLVVVYATIMNGYLFFDYDLNVEGKCRLTSKLNDESYWVPRIVSFVLRDCILLFVFTFTNIHIVSWQRRYKSVAWKRGALWLKRRLDHIKIIRLTTVMAASYFILTLPMDLFDITLLFSRLAGRPLKGDTSTLLAYSYCQWLQTMNSCVNIIIFYKMHKGFRKFFRKRFLCFRRYYRTEVTLDNL